MSDNNTPGPSNSNNSDNSNSNNTGEPTSVKRARLNNRAQQNLEVLGEYLLRREYNTTCYHNYDHFLARWQARQMAKGFVDNTINRVLDSWLTSPIPQSIEYNRPFAMDVADYFDNMCDDDSVENEGILMAISAHGLHNHDDRETDIFSSRHEPVAGPSRRLDDEPTPCNCTTSREIEEPSVPLIPFHRRQGSSNDNNIWQMINNPKVPISNNNNNSVEESAIVVSNETDSDSGDNSSSSSESSVVAETKQTESGESQIEEDHFDFMDQAVSYAIQNKGLMPFGSVDYG